MTLPHAMPRPREQGMLSFVPCISNTNTNTNTNNNRNAKVWRSKWAWSLVALMTLLHLSTNIRYGCDKNQVTQKAEESPTLLSSLPSINKMNGATGSLFEGTVIRSFDQPRFFVDTLTTTTSNYNRRQSFKKNSRAFSCLQWSVVTTIFEPSLAVKRAAALSYTQQQGDTDSDSDSESWCIVIVADTNTPTDYMEKAGFLYFDHNSQQPKENVHFLSIQDQQNMIAATSSSSSDNKNSAIRKFLEAIPYGHFARKNIGYLYAMQRGATLIFDFDDDNVLHLDNETGNVLSPIPPLTQSARVAMVGNKLAFNHHPLMGASLGKESWARGFPLSLIQDHATHGTVAYNDTEPLMMMNTKLAVLQICANGDPDVDAIHRLVKPLPMTFDQDTATSAPLIVPSHTFAPYNAQATIHTTQAHWALLLPITVPGRVSDIWRSYFAQAIFRHLNLQIAFVPPRVTQFRNQHNYLADAKAELDLYFKTEKLLEFLQQWQCTKTLLQDTHYPTVPFCMEQLWIELFEREYIEINDVLLVQLWLKALVETEYQFPTIQPDRRHRHDDIVVMGQFNYNSALPDVLFWNQIWRQWVDHLQVRGPFTPDQLEQMSAHGIEAHTGRNDRGWVSPMENLMQTCQQYQGKDGITGILYVHDDALVNVPKLFPREDAKRGQHVLATFTILDPRKPITNPALLSYLEHTSYRILKDGVTFAKASGFQTNSVDALIANLNTPRMWPNHPACVLALQKVSQDPRSNLYKEPDGSFLVPGKGQSDFFYVPMRHADAFIQATQLITDHNVMLECGFPKLLDILWNGPSNATTVEVPLCTSWDLDTRGTTQMIKGCLSKSYTVYHPYKIGVAGYKTWGDDFEKVCRNN
jgi:STELLO glycosyltransferases